MKRVDTGPRMCAPVTYTQPLLLLDDLFADSETKSKKLAKKRRDKRQTMLRKKFEGKKKETIKNKEMGK
jgi:hypothetical protein